MKNKTFIITLPLMLLLFGLVVYQYGFLAIQIELESIKEEQSIKARTLQKYVDLISQRSMLEQTHAMLTERLKDQELKFIEGQTSAIASANLQGMIKDIVTGVRGAIASERIGKPEDLGKFKVITVGMDMNLPDVKALSDVIYSIETRAEHLAINDIDVRVRNFRDPRELLVRIEVSAMIKGR